MMTRFSSGEANAWLASIRSICHGSHADRRPARQSASRTSDATISTPSTDRESTWACQSASPWAAAEGHAAAPRYLGLTVLTPV